MRKYYIVALCDPTCGNELFIRTIGTTKSLKSAKEIIAGLPKGRYQLCWWGRDRRVVAGPVFSGKQ